MLPLAPAGLTAPAVAGRGLSELLGRILAAVEDATSHKKADADQANPEHDHPGCAGLCAMSLERIFWCEQLGVCRSCCDDVKGCKPVSELHGPENHNLGAWLQLLKL